MELRNSLASRFNLELPSTVIFDYPSVEALTTFIVSRQHGEQETQAGSEAEDFSEEEELEGPPVDIEAVR